MVKYWAIAAAIGSLAMTGCTETIFKPFDADKGSVSMDARQRTILSVERGTPPDSHRIVCAEPSPDALATIAASAGVSGGISGIIPQLPGSVDLATSFASGEQAAMIGARNSTIQLLRDGLYRACEAYMNGALGDFGYGLVLVNYGKVMVSLLTADGLTHPALVPATVIGSTPGNTTQSAQGSGGTPVAASSGGQNAAAGGAAAVAPAAGPAGGASHTASSGTGAATALPAGAASPVAATSQLNEQEQVVFENVVLPLANPTVDPAGKFIEVTVACMLWLDNTGLKKPQPGNDALQKFCGEIVRRAPDVAGPAIRAKLIHLYGAEALAAADKAEPRPVAFNQ